MKKSLNRFCSLRVAQDDVIASCLDLIESRRHLFADALQKGNELLHTTLQKSDNLSSEGRDILEIDSPNSLVKADFPEFLMAPNSSDQTTNKDSHL